MRLAFVSALILGLLSACSDPPCEAAAADKAGAYYGECIKGQQLGDGGYGCGRSAYRSFCTRQAGK